MAGDTPGQECSHDDVGPWETTSPSSCGALEPLEHSVLIHADPAGQHAAVGTLSHLTVTLLAQLARMLQGAGRPRCFV